MGGRRRGRAARAIGEMTAKERRKERRGEKTTERRRRSSYTRGTAQAAMNKATVVGDGGNDQMTRRRRGRGRGRGNKIKIIMVGGQKNKEQNKMQKRRRRSYGPADVARAGLGKS